MSLSVSHRSIAATAVITIALLALGLWALDLQARQTRDVKRALDLEDLETALRRLLGTTGTLPPADQPTWCGVVNIPEHQAIRESIERALRETQKYQNPSKPFPADPRFAGKPRDYLYWKTSPVSFELLSELEADDNNSRRVDLTRCALLTEDSAPARTRHRFADVGGGEAGGYDYAISSLARSPL